jgi:L-ascorbate metabolism protein UlaG (beta-lactamase superfamily)
VSDGRRCEITYLGHSTVLIAMDGRRILTDPILRQRVGPLVRAGGPVAPRHWTGIDAVLISHSHWDHLDPGSLRLVGVDVPLVVPMGMAGRLRSRGFRRIVELVPGERTSVAGVELEATSADHRGFSPPIGATGLALGFLISGDQRIYFPGDTALFAGMERLARGLDLALMPVWGWGPTVRGSEHLDPMGAARALQLLRPRVAVPIHWGTLHPVGLRWLRPSTRVDPPHAFARLAARLAPATTVEVLPVGASLELSDVTVEPTAQRPGREP